MAWYFSTHSPKVLYNNKFTNLKEDQEKNMSNLYMVLIRHTNLSYLQAIYKIFNQKIIFNSPFSPSLNGR